MPLPLVLLGIAAVTGTAGAVNAVQGVLKTRRATDKARRATALHKSGCRETQAAIDALNLQAAGYGEHQARVALTTVARFVELIRTRGQRASAGDFEALEGFDLARTHVEDYEGLIAQLGGLLGGSLKAAGVAAGVHQGAFALVGLVGTASTGTAISGLSGVALTNATLAWLGGGSLAAGGGGMALGTIVLGSLAAGPALLVGGLLLNGQGEKASTKAAEYAADVHVDLGRQRLHVEFLQRVGRRLEELSAVLSQLDDRAAASLDRLETLASPDDAFAVQFQETALLVAALAEILRTPVLVEKDSGGLEFNEATTGLLSRCRPLAEASNA
jgi:hypothetical protein